MSVRQRAIWPFAAAIAAFWVSGLPAAAQQPPAIPVTVSKPLAKRITRWDEYSGRFEAVNTVEVRARVSGFIDKVNFKDGQLVKEGDLLFTLDKRPYELAVESARADIARFGAQVEFAMADLERAQPLAKSGAISEQTFEQRRSNLSVARAQLQAAQVAVRTSELNLDWTEVRAPISGRISDRKVDVGNLVAGGQAAATTLLATIVSGDPIHFLFDISETDFLRYARLNTSGDRQSRDASSPVRIKLADEEKFTREGVMDFLDNQLSTRSGTLRGRAVVPNKDELLQPGLFGRLQLFGGEFDALLIPDDAVVSDQARKIVFLVGADNVVKPAPVTLGPIVDGLRVVQTGLKPEDLVVVGGIANPAVRPGAKVAPKQGEIKAVASN
ncbi:MULTISPECIES: efflux RND transporter periplasmic adaptor subunit [Rhodomicrobium]|uniref:efflux RND transporter periplasmic adaptor subunit n=1 Tax=Rhodomicrobium TaxID=1068 RepID=UPI000B4C0AC9|nr:MULTISPECIES: efflux RND transporter periplasmic adaptor subunit [Rhodomicrobium]